MLSHLQLPYSLVDADTPVFDHVNRADDPVECGKQVLFLTKNRGAFIRDCPGTRCYNCCDYTILHIGTYCTMDCSYCILQSYFHPPVLRFFVNHDDMFRELDALFSQKYICRLGTGEFTDSLIWERWTGLSEILVPRFAAQRHAVLELKTKTVAIDSLEHLDHHRKTIVSWSVNARPVIASEERRTATLKARLAAAAKCESWGYPVSFHFDPIILYDGCEKDYRQVVDAIFSHVNADNVVWISLGTFRYLADMKPLIERRFPDSSITGGEFIPGLDRKMRYFKPLRIGFYRKMVSWIREKAPNVVVYFCMEDDEVWEKSLGFIPKDRGGLKQMLDDSAAEHCDLG